MSAPRGLLAGLALLSAASLAGALSIGSVELTAADLLALLRGGGGDVQRTVLFELRPPRALSAFAVGGLLALAGALMQVLLRNPLADPYILGVSGGAAVATLLAMLLGAAAFGGALLTLLLVFALAVGIAGKTVCRDLNIRITAGERWAVLGPNGSGKTTLLHGLTGLRPVDGGEVLSRAAR